MSNRSFIRVVIVALLGMAGVSLGCDKSVVSPTPLSAAAAAVPVTDPAPVTLQGVILTASPSAVTSGDRLTMTWVAPSGRGCVGGGDWVALYKVGDADSTGSANGHSDLWFLHVCGATSGTATLSAPPEAGQYEFRYLAGPTASARSNPVTVTASTSPLGLVPTLRVDGGTASSHQIGQTFWVTGSGYTAGQMVRRYLDPPVNGSAEITPLTADRLGNLSWAFTPTCADHQNTVAIYALDVTTGRASNTITETVTDAASCR